MFIVITLVYVKWYSRFDLSANFVSATHEESGVEILRSIFKN